MGSRSRLGDLEELVLLAVFRLGDHAYGASIRSELESRAGRAPSISTIYVTLLRLEEKGYVTSSLGEPTRERGGKAKRFFKLAPEGIRALESVRRVRERMWEGLDAEARTRVP